MIAFEVQTIWVIFILSRIILKRGTLIIGGLVKCTVRIYKNILAFEHPSIHIPFIR